MRERESGQSATCQPGPPANRKGEAQMKSAGTLITICLLFAATTLFAQTKANGS